MEVGPAPAPALSHTVDEQLVSADIAIPENFDTPEDSSEVMTQTGRVVRKRKLFADETFGSKK